jgi:hypothetical protein
VPELLLRDGSEIQRTVAELHGDQRAKLGWSESAFWRESEIVREEVVAAIQRACVGLPADDVDRASRLLLGTLGRIAEISARRLRVAPSAREP